MTAARRDPQNEPDHYAVLGVGTDATDTEISRAFRRLARAHHPDRHPGDADAARRFAQVALAHQVLSDPLARADYDRARHVPRPEPGAPDTGQPIRIAVREARTPARAADPSLFGRPRPLPPLWAGPVRYSPVAPRPGSGRHDR